MQRRRLVLVLALVTVAVFAGCTTQVQGPVDVQQDCALAYNIEACKAEKAHEAEQAKAKADAEAKARADEDAAAWAYRYAAYTLPVQAAVASALFMGLGTLFGVRFWVKKWLPGAAVGAAFVASIIAAGTATVWTPGHFGSAVVIVVIGWVVGTVAVVMAASSANGSGYY